MRCCTLASTPWTVPVPIASHWVFLCGDCLDGYLNFLVQHRMNVTRALRCREVAAEQGRNHTCSPRGSSTLIKALHTKRRR